MQDKIYISNTTGNVVPEGYPNATAYVSMEAFLRVSKRAEELQDINDSLKAINESLHLHGEQLFNENKHLREIIREQQEGGNA